MFLPENLLREARRQESLPAQTTPEICVLDPDRDILEWLVSQNRVTRNPSWACCHTDLHEFVLEGIRVGIIAGAVGAPFAVLVAEELFASGCRLLTSHHRSKGVLAVEMEAAALYAFANAVRAHVVCFAYVTNQMGSIGGDFEKGSTDGTADALRFISVTARSWQAENWA